MCNPLVGYLKQEYCVKLNNFIIFTVRVARSIVVDFLDVQFNNRPKKMKK